MNSNQLLTQHKGSRITGATCGQVWSTMPISKALEGNEYLYQMIELNNAPFILKNILVVAFITTNEQIR